MLKFDKIIHRLTLEEKVELLVSNKKNESSVLDDFDLPRFKIVNQALDFKTLSSTWDLDLIHDAAYNTAIPLDEDENIILNACSINTTEYNANMFSTDKYLAGKFAAAFLKGINDAGFTSALSDVEGYAPKEEDLRREELLAAEVAIKEGHPNVIISNSTNNLDIVADEYNYHGDIIASTTDVALAFYNGCHFVFSTDDPKAALLKAIEGYAEALQNLATGAINQITIDQMEREGLIFNPNRIDEILDKYLDFLYDLDKKNRGLKENNNFANIEGTIASKSIIMLKNNGVLPITKADSLLICGAEAFNGGNESPVKIAESFDLNIIGAVHGYSFDLDDDTPLLREAIKVAEDADYILCFLTSNDSIIEDRQLETIMKFKELGKKVISVVMASGEIITNELYDYSDAVIEVGCSHKEAFNNIFNLLISKFEPVGRTTWVTRLPGINPDLNDNETYRFPLGYGLSFTSFEYSKIQADKHGVSFNIKNTGITAGSELTTLYVEYENPDSKERRKLRGFKMVTLKPNESARVFIDFDEFTFKSYNASNCCDEIKTGTYNLIISSAYNDDKIQAKIDLKGRLINPNGSENIVDDCNDSIDEVLNKFRDSGDRREFFSERKGLKFKTKMILLVLILIYFDLMFIYIGTSYINNSNAAAKGIFIGFAILINIVGIVIGVYLVKNKNKNIEFKDYPLKESELDSLVNKMDSYHEIGKITYTKPIEPTDQTTQEEVEDEVVSLEDINVDNSQEKETEYLEDEYECDESGIEFAKDIYPAEYVQAYNDYSSNNGIIIEPKSSRALFSALGSTHMLILKAGLKDLLDSTIDLVLSYLGNNHNVFDLANVESINDLLWEEVDENTYKRTSFSSLLANMRKLKKTCNVIVFKNADMNNLRSTLGSLIDFVINPNGDNYINLGTAEGEDLVLIPKNLIIIIEPNDDNYLDSFDPVLAERSLSVELQLRINELDPIEAPEIKYMSYDALERMAKDCKERNIIPEEYWKKLDDLEEEINNLEPFRFENKTILDFERFVGLMIEAGGDIDESIDMALAYRIVPILKSYKIYKNNDGDKTLYEIISRIFTEENTELTKRAIKKTLN